MKNYTEFSMFLNTPLFTEKSIEVVLSELKKKIDELFKNENMNWNNIDYIIHHLKKFFKEPETTLKLRITPYVITKLKARMVFTESYSINTLIDLLNISQQTNDPHILTLVKTIYINSEDFEKITQISDNFPNIESLEMSVRNQRYVNKCLEFIGNLSESIPSVRKIIIKNQSGYLTESTIQLIQSVPTQIPLTIDINCYEETNIPSMLRKLFLEYRDKNNITLKFKDKEVSIDQIPEVTNPIDATTHRYFSIGTQSTYLRPEDFEYAGEHPGPTQLYYTPEDMHLFEEGALTTEAKAIIQNALDEPIGRKAFGYITRSHTGEVIHYILTNNALDVLIREWVIFPTCATKIGHEVFIGLKTGETRRVSKAGAPGPDPFQTKQIDYISTPAIMRVVKKSK